MGEDKRLVDTDCAVMWTGRTRETLYRWAREGRIERHGRRTPQGARWNLNELPRYNHMCSLACLEGKGCPPLPEPPLIRLPRPRQPVD